MQCQFKTRSDLPRTFAVCETCGYGLDIDRGQVVHRRCGSDDVPTITDKPANQLSAIDRIVARCTNRGDVVRQIEVPQCMCGKPVADVRECSAFGECTRFESNTGIMACNRCPPTIAKLHELGIG